MLSLAVGPQCHYGMVLDPGLHGDEEEHLVGQRRQTGVLRLKCSILKFFIWKINLFFSSLS